MLPPLSPAKQSSARVYPTINPTRIQDINQLGGGERGHRARLEGTEPRRRHGLRDWVSMEGMGGGRERERVSGRGLEGETKTREKKS